MRTRHKRRKWWRYAVGALLVVVMMAVIAGAVGWMAFQRIPSWYRPADVPQADLPRIRNSLPNTYEELNNLINRGEPFEFSITARTLTEWVVVRDELYPDARDWLPSWVKDPVVTFEDDRCIIGARIDYEGWQAIVGIHLVARVSNETITLRIDKLTAGALPIPVERISEPLARLISGKHLDIELLPDPIAPVVRKLRGRDPSDLLAAGLSWPNLLHTKTGRRVVKILGVSASDGVLRVQIEPR